MEFDKKQIEELTKTMDDALKFKEKATTSINKIVTPEMEDEMTEVQKQFIKKSQNLLNDKSPSMDKLQELMSMYNNTL
jgi:hypothetical protein